MATVTKGLKPPSYEGYAPRSAPQISRLGRLEALTKGPAALAVPKEDVGSAFVAKSLAPLLVDDENLKDPRCQKVFLEACGVSDSITCQQKHTTSLRLAVRASINIAEDLSNRHAQLLRHSSELSAAADRLKEEEQILSKRADDIGKPLQHYDAVDRIGVLVGVLFKNGATVRGLAKVKVDDEEFPGLLDQIDLAVDYFGNESGGRRALATEKKNPTASGNVEYYRRALALQDTALNLIRIAVADRISSTAEQIGATLKAPVNADQLEASVIYTRFHGISARSGRLLGLVKDRLNRDRAYGELLRSCQHAYCLNRERLLQSTVKDHMEKLKTDHGPVGMTRLASLFLIRLCTVETNLYLEFFGNGESDKNSFKNSTFQAYLMRLCALLHRTLRRGLVNLLDLDILCQMVSVLREERTQAMESAITLPAAKSISSVIKDAQERLIFCANNMLTKQVVRFKATPADLDYPDKLKKQESTQGQDEKESSAEAELNQAYEHWFPPIRTILRVLSKIFRVVEPVVFEDIARTSVQACTKSLKEGSAYIKKRKGNLDGDLFLVKHLLILREQLSPFDLEWQVVERQLDFSDAGKAVARFWANRNRRVFSMRTNENALVSLLREGVSIQESRVDSKRDLEEALRSACTDFIAHAAEVLIGDISQMVETCKSSDATSMSIQSHLNPDVLLGALSRTYEELASGLQNLEAQMELYLDTSATQSILLKPVTRKILRTSEDLRKLLTQCDDGWAPENKEEVDRILLQLEARAKKLDSTQLRE